MSSLSSDWRNPLRDERDKRLPRIAGPCGLVIFGVTGDLSRKKLMPAVYDLANRGLLPPGFALTGFARRDWADAGLRPGRLRGGPVARPDAVPGVGLAAAGRGHPVRARGLRRRRRVRRAAPGPSTSWTTSRGTGGNHAFYLSIPPKFFPDGHQAAGPVRAGGAGRRAVAAGRHREAVRSRPQVGARAQRDRRVDVFPPDSVFRIDHYLGKETVQNLLALRFANQMFEPIWNANYVDHVQITMAEDIGIGGRAGYYDGIGAARDVIQNHLLQLLALTAMEEPVSFEAQDLRGEKEKVLSAVRLPEDLGRPHRARPVRAGLAGRRAGHRLPAGGGHLRRLDDRDVRRGQARHRHPALGRRAVLPAHRQAARAGGSPRSPSCSSGRRTCRSSGPPPRSSARTRSSSGCSPTRA